MVKEQDLNRFAFLFNANEVEAMTRGSHVWICRIGKRIGGDGKLLEKMQNVEELIFPKLLKLLESR